MLEIPVFTAVYTSESKSKNYYENTPATGILFLLFIPKKFKVPEIGVFWESNSV